jgi:hypothetical protein
MRGLIVFCLLFATCAFAQVPITVEKQDGTQPCVEIPSNTPTSLMPDWTYVERTFRGEFTYTMTLKVPDLSKAGCHLDWNTKEIRLDLTNSPAVLEIKSAGGIVRVSFVALKGTIASTYYDQAKFKDVSVQPRMARLEFLTTDAPFAESDRVTPDHRPIFEPRTDRWANTRGPYSGSLMLEKTVDLVKVAVPSLKGVKAGDRLYSNRTRSGEDGWATVTKTFSSGVETDKNSFVNTSELTGATDTEAKPFTAVTDCGTGKLANVCVNNVINFSVRNKNLKGTVVAVATDKIIFVRDQKENYVWAISADGKEAVIK